MKAYLQHEDESVAAKDGDVAGEAAAVQRHHAMQPYRRKRLWSFLPRAGHLVLFFKVLNT